MDWKTCSIIKSVGGHEGFEQLVERGRRMHNQAVFNLFAWLVLNAVTSLKKGSGMMIRKRDSRKYSGGLSIKYSS